MCITVHTQNAYSPALKHSLEHIRTIAGQESDGYGGTLLDDEDFIAKVADVEVQVLAMEFTELRILSALAA